MGVSRVRIAGMIDCLFVVCVVQEREEKVIVGSEGRI
jgi:hypothetical protein